MSIRLIKAEVLHFPPECYESVFAISNKVFETYACGIDPEIAKKIIADYKNSLDKSR